MFLSSGTLLLEAGRCRTAVRTAPGHEMEGVELETLSRHTVQQHVQPSAFYLLHTGTIFVDKKTLTVDSLQSRDKYYCAAL